MMKRRDGKLINQTSRQVRLLEMLYGNVVGRALLRTLVSPVVSKIAGWFLSSGISRILIQPFIRRNGIDMEQFEPRC